MRHGIILISLVMAMHARLFAQQAPAFQPSDTLPVFETTDVNAQPFRLDSVLKRPVVIVFWATWNEASRQLVDELKQIYPSVNPVRRARLQQNIDVIDFCLDTKPDLHQVALKRENYPWAVHLADYKGWESELITRLGIVRIPTLFILDEQRRILVLDPDIKQLRNILSNIRVDQQLSN